MTADRVFLLVTAAGLTPIALSYGAMPANVLTALFGFPVEGVNLTHIFRAVMGLYLAMVLLWIAGACVQSLRMPALWSVVTFMLGLAAGRLVSLSVDGPAHWLLSVYMGLELAFGIVGLWMIRRSGREVPA